jgi:hypothetical protein
VPQPNILLIMSDQHRADVMGCSADPVVRTPHIDRLARRGHPVRERLLPGAAVHAGPGLAADRAVRPRPRRLSEQHGYSRFHAHLRPRCRRGRVLHLVHSDSPHLTDAVISDIRRFHYGNITVIDDGIDRILQATERRGLLDNTWVIYTSDHGEMMGEHRMLTKMVFYEQAVQVPLIIRPPVRLRPAGGHGVRQAPGPLGHHPGYRPVGRPPVLRRAVAAGLGRRRHGLIQVRDLQRELRPGNGPHGRPQARVRRGNRRASAALRSPGRPHETSTSSTVATTARIATS